MSAARTDVHRPSVINPSEYDWVAFQYYGGSDLGAILAMKAERERLAAHMAHTGGRFSGHEHGGVCHVCGTSNVAYANVFYHRPTNTYIVTGEDCAQKMDMAYNEAGMSAFRKTIHHALEARAGKMKAKATLEVAGLARCWEIFTSEVPAPGSEEVTVCDIVGKLVRYGSASDKQMDFLRTLLQRIDGRAAKEAKRQAEDDAAAPCPTGRLQVVGTVLTIRVDDGPYGSVTKMLVKADSGFKVWGTRTANFERGQRVRFTATVEPSPNDPKFGFFKRPSKGEVIE